MIIQFLDNLEIPDSLIDEWVETDSADPRYVEKQTISYLKANSDWEWEIGVLFTGTDVLIQFGYHQALEEEGFYYGSQTYANMELGKRGFG